MPNYEGLIDPKEKYGILGKPGSDIADSSIGRIASGLGSFLLDTGASMISPAYKENLIGQNKMIREEGLRKRGRAYSDKLWGQEASTTPYDAITQELVKEDMQSSGPVQPYGMPQQEVAGTGMMGGKMTIQDYLQKQQSNPNKAIGMAANSMLADRLKQKTKGAVNFNDYDQYSEAKKLRYHDFMKNKRAALVNINNAAGQDPIAPGTVIRDAQGNLVPIPVGAVPNDYKDGGYTYGKRPTDSEVRSEVSSELSMKLLDDLKVMQDSGVQVSGVRGFLDELRSGADAGSVAANALFNSIGMHMQPENAKMLAITSSLGNQLLHAIRGAQVGIDEKEDFIKQLPAPGQPSEVFEANRIQTKKNLLYINTLRRKESRGIDRQDPADIIEAREVEQTNTAIQPGDIEDGYVYLGGDRTKESNWRKQ